MTRDVDHLFMCPLHISCGTICITIKWEAAPQVMIFAQVESPIPLCVWDGRWQHVPWYLGETEGWGLCLPEEGGFEHVRPSRRPRGVYLPLGCPRINSTLALGSFCPRIVPPVLAGWAWALASWLGSRDPGYCEMANAPGLWAHMVPAPSAWLPPDFTAEISPPYAGVVQLPAFTAHVCPGPRAWHRPERQWLISCFPSMKSAQLHPLLSTWAWGGVGWGKDI